MISRSEAQKRAYEFINSDNVDKEDYVIVDGETLQFEEGWVFFYQSRKFLETRNISHALAGNGPLFVSKATGEITALSSAQPVEASLKEIKGIMPK